MPDEHDDDLEPEVDESDVETVHYGEVTDADDQESDDRVTESDDDDDDAIDDEAPDSI